MATSKKVTDRAYAVPTSTPLIEPRDPVVRDHPKTAPGQFMQFMAKESAAMQENEALKAENKSLKSSEIEISSIIEVEGRRRTLSPEKFAELVDNLRNNPLSTPVTVRSVGAGKFELVSGHNRVHGFKVLGRARIPAFVADFDDLQAIKGAFYANLISDTLPDYEKFKGFKEIMARTGQTQTEAAKEAGITESSMSKVMEFDRLPKEAIEVIAQRPDAVTYTAITKLRKLPGMLDGLKAIVHAGATLNEAVAIASAIKEKSVAIKTAPVIIKNGQERVAEIVRREGVVTVKFKDSAMADVLAVEMEKLIRSHLKK